MADTASSSKKTGVKRAHCDEDDNKVLVDFGPGPKKLNVEEIQQYQHGDDLDAEFKDQETVEIDFGDDDDEPPMEEDSDDMLAGSDVDGEDDKEDRGFIEADEDEDANAPDESTACTKYDNSVLAVAVSPANPRLVASGSQ